MPRPTRHRARFHRDRVIAKRHAVARSLLGHWGLLEDWERWYARRPVGELANDQAWLGCGHPRCGLCHPHKRWSRTADRKREERAWRRDWAVEEN